MTAPTIRFRRLAAQVADELGRRILTGQLTDDHVLPKEDELPVEFAISKPSLPEAMRLLKAEGLLDRLDHQSSFCQHERIGTDHIMLESDYPHCDSTWPNTQRVIHEEISSLPSEVIQKFAWQNASRLYQHPVPEAIPRDPDAF